MKEIVWCLYCNCPYDFPCMIGRHPYKFIEDGQIA
jgi:hypothetical protein